MGKYFTIAELCNSATAKKRGIDNTPTEDIKKNLNKLIDNILDPLRVAYGKPIRVSSGYRCAALNTAVGGVKKSEHREGRAADLVVGTKSENTKLFNLAIAKKLPFRQIILENGGQWVHISYNENDIKRQVIYG
jgi:uncharacterized protein YcbK (DUF882 family)